MFPKEDRNSIIGKGKENASLAATAAHAVPATETARVALPDAYAWGERSKTISDAGLAASTFTHAKSSSSDGRSASMLSTSSSISASSAAYAKNGALRDSTAPDSSYMLGNIGNLEEIARKKATERLNKIYLPSSNTNIYAPRHNNSAAGGVAAAAAHISAEEETARINRENLEAKNAANQYVAVMALARERAENSIAQLNKEAHYKNPLLNTQYYQEALAIAQEKGAARMENYGKVDIGGGVFMTQTEVDAIAERNVRPVLVEISEKADAQRQADEDRRIAEEEERKRIAEAKRIQQEEKAEERRKNAEQKAAHKAIQKEHLAKQKAIAATQRNAERERRDAERKVAEEKKREERAVIEKKKAEERAIADKKKAEERARKNEERAVQKAAKQELLEQRRKEKHALKVAAQASATAAAIAKEAQALAAADVKKTKALAAQADAKLQAAKLAETQAATEEEAEKARVETEKAKAELAKAEIDVKAAEARKLDAEAEKEKIDHKVHDAVAAQKDLERKYNQDISNMAVADPTAISKDLEEPEDEQVTAEAKQILEEASAQVDAENNAAESLYNHDNNSFSSFATAEGESVYSTQPLSEEVVDKGTKPSQQVKSMLDVESVKSLKASKPIAESSLPSSPESVSTSKLVHDDPKSTSKTNDILKPTGPIVSKKADPDSEKRFTSSASPTYPVKSMLDVPQTPKSDIEESHRALNNAISASKPTAVTSSLDDSLASPTSPSQPVKSMLDVESVHKVDKDAIDELKPAAKISSPDTSDSASPKPLLFTDDESVAKGPEPVEPKVLDSTNLGEETEPVVADIDDLEKTKEPESLSPVVPVSNTASIASEKAPVKDAAVKPNVSVSIPKPDAPATTPKSVKKKSSSTGILSRIKKAVSPSKPSEPTSSGAKDPSQAAAAAASALSAKKQNGADASRNIKASPAVSKTVKPSAARPKPIDRTFSGFSQGGEEEDEELPAEQVEKAFAKHDSIEDDDESDYVKVESGLDAPTEKPYVSSAYEEEQPKSPAGAVSKNAPVDLAGNVVDAPETAGLATLKSEHDDFDEEPEKYDDHVAPVSGSLADEPSYEYQNTDNRKNKETYSMVPTVADATTATPEHPSIAFATTIAAAVKQAEDEKEAEESPGLFGKVISSLIPGVGSKGSDAESEEIGKGDQYDPVFKEDVK